MGNRTIKLTFDCGKAGKVTWEAPRDRFDPALSDRQLQQMAPLGLRIVPLFFRLLDVLNMADRTITDQTMDELETNIGAVARRAAVRMGLPPR